MRAKLYSVIFLVLILLFSVASIFIFDMNYKIPTTDGLIVYYTSKAIALLLLVAVGLLVTLKNYRGGMPVMMICFAVIFQFLPLGIRFLTISSENMTFPWILTFIVSIVFIGLILVFEYISSKDSMSNE